MLLKFLGFEGQQVIEQQMAMLMGDAGREIAQEMIASAKSNEGWLAAIASFALLLWGASNVFAQLQDSMNTIWEVQLRPDLALVETIQRRFLSMAMVFGIGFLLLTSMFVSTMLAAAAHQIAGDAALVTTLLDTLLTCVVTTASSRDLQGAAGCEGRLARRGSGCGARRGAVRDRKEPARVVSRGGSTASAFGAAGSLAAVLIWVYYSAQIMFFGAEFTQAHAEVLRSPDRVGRRRDPGHAGAARQQGLDRGRPA